MKKKSVCKIVIDLAMTVLLLFLMARQFTGDSAHEWLGAGMLILWTAHHFLNRNWYRHLFKGSYTPVRIWQTVINFAVLIPMFGSMASGILLSKEVFAFLPISGSAALTRPLHVFFAFWGFLLMALHLGLHWYRILDMVRKAAGPAASKPLRVLLRAAAVFLAGYGLSAFVKNQFPLYLSFTDSYVFFDFERPVLFFFTEYIAVMGLFVFPAHYIRKFCVKNVRRGQEAAGGRKRRLLGRINCSPAMKMDERRI